VLCPPHLRACATAGSSSSPGIASGSTATTSTSSSSGCRPLVYQPVVVLHLPFTDLPLGAADNMALPESPPASPQQPPAAADRAGGPSLGPAAWSQPSACAALVPLGGLLLLAPQRCVPCCMRWGTHGSRCARGGTWQQQQQQQSRLPYACTPAFCCSSSPHPLPGTTLVNSSRRSCCFKPVVLPQPGGCTLTHPGAVVEGGGLGGVLDGSRCWPKPVGGAGDGGVSEYGWWVYLTPRCTCIHGGMPAVLA
jgi:hypothetical protein